MSGRRRGEKERGSGSEKWYEEAGSSSAFPAPRTPSSQTDRQTDIHRVKHDDTTHILIWASHRNFTEDTLHHVCISINLFLMTILMHLLTSRAFSHRKTACRRHSDLLSANIHSHMFRCRNSISHLEGVERGKAEDFTNAAWFVNRAKAVPGIRGVCCHGKERFRMR